MLLAIVDDSYELFSIVSVGLVISPMGLVVVGLLRRCKQSNRLRHQFLFLGQHLRHLIEWLLWVGRL